MAPASSLALGVLQSVLDRYVGHLQLDGVRQFVGVVEVVRGEHGRLPGKGLVGTSQNIHQGPGTALDHCGDVRIGPTPMVGDGLLDLLLGLGGGLMALLRGCPGDGMTAAGGQG